MKKLIMFLLSVVLLTGMTLPFWGQQVTPGGSFSYGVPISAPKGTNGMGPAITLAYNSHKGNGKVGMGWSLTGLNVISRDHSYGINFNSGDHYTIGGQKLIYSSSTGRYHKESEDYSYIKGL